MASNTEAVIKKYWQAYNNIYCKWNKYIQIKRAKLMYEQLKKLSGL